MKLTSVVITLALMLFYAAASYGIDSRFLNSAGLQDMRQEAPDFTIKGPDGQRISLKDYRGKVVILHFWATWCKPCKEELPSFERLYQSLRGKDAVFLPISIDKTARKEEVDTFVRELGATFPVYLGREGSVTGRYSTWGVPVTYFIDKKGWVIGRAIGPRNWGSDSVSNLIDALLENR